MSLRPRQLATTVGRVLACGLIVVAVGIAVPRGTSALLAARGVNASSSFSMTALYAPPSLTGTPSGHDVQVAWTAGQNGSGYSVLGLANGASSTCGATGYATLGSTSALTYADLLRYTPQGSWYCYQVQATYSSWTSVVNPAVAVQLGVVVSTIALANGGTAGALDPGDRFVVTFNQPITTTTAASGTDSVCATSASSPSAQVNLGSTATSGSCSTGETLNLGKLTGGGSTKNARFNATYAWSNSNTTLTVTVGSRTVGSSNPTISGAWAITPTTALTKLLSATGAYHTCDTTLTGGSCRPATSGSL